MIPIPKGLFITPGRQSQPFRQARSSLGQYQMPARARAGQDEDKATEGLLMAASLAAKEYNQQAGFERNELKKKAENTYLETLAFQEATNLENPHAWRKTARAAAQNVITDGTANANPVLDFLFNDKRANEALTTHLDKIDAEHARFEHDAIAKQRVRQVNVAKRTLFENMVLKIDRGKRDKDNDVESDEVRRAGGHFNYLRDTTANEVNDIIKDIKSFSHMSKDKKSELIDKLVEDWGTALVGAMTQFEPDALHQHEADMQFLFSDAFHNGDFTKYFDIEYQNKRFKSLGSLIKARKEMHLFKAEGEGQVIVNSLGELQDKVIKKLQEPGNPGGEWIENIRKQVDVLLKKAGDMPIPGTVADPISGKTSSKNLFTKAQIRAFGSSIYDPLFFPVRQKLIRDLQELSGDKNYENARALLDSMQDPENPGGTWNTWKSLISQRAREAALTAFEREATKEQRLKASAEQAGKTRNLTALAKGLSTDFMVDMTAAFIDGVEKSGPGGEKYLTPLGTFTGKHTIRFEKLLNAQVEEMRLKLTAAGESPEVIAVRISDYKKHVADSTPALAKAMADIHHAGDISVVNKFSDAVKILMTARGGISAINRINDANRTAALADLDKRSGAITNQILDIMDKDTWRVNYTGRMLKDAITNLSNNYLTQMGVAKGIKASNSLQFMHSLVDTMETIERNRANDVQSFIQSGGIPPTTDLTARIKHLTDQINNIDNMDQVAIGPALRYMLYGSGEKGSKLLAHMKANLMATKKMLGAFNSFQLTGASISGQGITAGDFKKFLNFNKILTDTQKSTAFGPNSDNIWLGAEETFQTPLTLWETMIGALGDGKRGGSKSALLYMSLAPDLASEKEFMPMFRSRINRAALQNGRHKDILAYGQAANTLLLHSKHMGTTKFVMNASDRSELGRMAASWWNSNNQGLSGYEQARYMMDHFDRTTMRSQEPRSGSIYAKYGEFGRHANEKRNALADAVIKRLTRDIGSPFKDWFKYDHVEASASLRETIYGLMRLGDWSGSVGAERPKFADEEAYVRDWIYDSLLAESYVGIDILGTSQEKGFFRFRDQEYDPGIYLNPKMANGTVTTFALNHQVAGTKVGQFVTKTTGGGVEEAQALSELFFGVTLLTRLEQAHKNGEDLHRAMQTFRFADVELAFSNDLGGARDILLAMADKYVWDRKGETNRPKNMDYNVGDSRSVFGLHVSAESGKLQDAMLFNAASRDRLNLLRDDGSGRNRSNFQVFPNLAQGSPVLIGGRPSTTVLLTDPRQWAPGMEWASEAATAVGIPKSALDIESLRDEKKSVLFHVQIPTSPDNSLAWKFVQAWMEGAKKKNQDISDSESAGPAGATAMNQGPRRGDQPGWDQPPNPLAGSKAAMSKRGGEPPPLELMTKSTSTGSSADPYDPDEPQDIGVSGTEYDPDEPQSTATGSSAASYDPDAGGIPPAVKEEIEVGASDSEVLDVLVDNSQFIEPTEAVAGLIGEEQELYIALMDSLMQLAAAEADFNADQQRNANSPTMLQSGLILWGKKKTSFLDEWGGMERIIKILQGT